MHHIGPHCGEKEILLFLPALLTVSLSFFVFCFAYNQRQKDASHGYFQQVDLEVSKHFRSF